MASARVEQPIDAYLVRVTILDDSIPEGASRLLYAAAFECPDEALAAVQRLWPGHDSVRVIDEKLSAHTADAIGLRRNEVTVL